MRLRRKTKTPRKTMPGFRLVNDKMHGGGAKLFLGDMDISSCVQRVEVDVSVDDVNRITIHAIAADVNLDLSQGEIKIIERAYQIHSPNDNLENTPVRELLSEIEEA